MESMLAIRTRLAICLRRQQVELGKVDLSLVELLELVSDVWLAEVLRQGSPDLPLERLRFDVAEAEDADAGDRLPGLELRVTLPTGATVVRPFGVQAFGHLAGQLASQLTAEGKLQAGDTYTYELRWTEAGPSPPMETGLAAVRGTTPLTYLRVPLPALLAQASWMGIASEGEMPVFYTRAAFESANQFARQGGNEQPPVETGAMLVGTPCSCPETGEFFVVVVDAFEAVGADSRQFSLEFPARTWSRWRTILKARQARRGCHALRFVGQAHGHPFLPLDGAPPCETCDQVSPEQCGRHTCFASTDDQLWSRVVFTRQPWQLCHIFGLNARGAPVHKLFGRRAGCLRERGFGVLSEFLMESFVDP